MANSSKPSNASRLDEVSLNTGQRLMQGRFSLVQPLGQGGMGLVWLARDEQLQEAVALKFLPAEIRTDPVALDDLRRETQKSRRLTHPHIVRIHDFHALAGEAPFLSMEYVDGPNLNALRVAQPQRVFAWEFIRSLFQRLCEALEYAHGEKVIHRDLKPANLMLDSKGRLKLADFGIAAVVSDSVSRVSLRHATSGTLAYMSPQQLAGKRPQVADDIYALGATLYELLTSKPPFYTGDLTHQILHEAPEPLGERLAALEIQNDIPPDIAALVMACLAKEPDQRPQSAGEVAHWLGGQPAATPADSPGNHDPAEPLIQPARGFKLNTACWAALAVMVMTLAVGGWYWRAQRSASKPPAAGVFELAGRTSVPFTGSLPGTIWMVQDSDGESSCFQFEANGVLQYQARRGIRPNGRWQQDGRNVNIDINDGFTTLTGIISGQKVTGKGSSRNGKTWTWKATPHP
jgi:serine/threonine protein kinase